MSDTSLVQNHVAPAGTADPAASGMLARWRRLIGLDAESAAAGLRDLYHSNRPQQAELIFTGACEFTCQHCIYPPHFARHNVSTTSERWRSVLRALETDLGIQSFVYGGRAVTPNGVRLLMRLRDDLPNAGIGLIDNGISVLPYLDELAQARLDWIDISFDGMPAHHDRQRGRVGSFRAALEGALTVMKRRLAPRLSVLTCLTTINAATVAEMACMLNRLGFKNFFATPMAMVRGIWPPPDLSLCAAEIIRVVRMYLDIASKLDDAYIEVGLFDAEQFAAVSAAPPFAASEFIEREDHLAWMVECGTATMAVRYWPASLAGLRELIVNADGRVLLPKSMAYGQVPPDSLVGDLFDRRPREVWRQMTKSSAFARYLHELELERRLLRDVVA